MKPTIPLALALFLVVLSGPVGSADDDALPVVTFSFEEEDVRRVITTLAEFASANVILAPEVQGRVTIRLQEVPWRWALEQVAGAVGAAVVEEAPGILRIMARPGGKAVIRTFDVRDLVKREPGLLEKLRRLVPGAAIEMQGGVVVARAPGEVLDGIEARLRDLRAGHGLGDPPGRVVDRHRISMRFDAAEGEQVLEFLRTVVPGLEVWATPGARERLAKATVSIDAEDVPVVQTLDLVAAAADVRWSRQGKTGVLFHMADESAEGFSGWQESPTAKMVRGYTLAKEPRGLAAQLQALRAEIRALRQEVEEIKAILLSDR